MRGMRVNMNKTKWRTSEASSSKESRVVYVAEVLVKDPGGTLFLQ